MISVSQIRAARALLAWSQADLANAAGVSRPTIERAETQGASDETMTAIQKALERAEVEFLPEGPGVRMKPIFVNARERAVLSYGRQKTDCPTVQEAVLEWRRLAPSVQVDATIRTQSGKQFKGRDIDRLYKRSTNEEKRDGGAAR